MIISLVFCLFLLVCSSSTLSCTPKFIMDATVQETISIYSFSTQNGQTIGTYQYNYFQSMFKTQPQTILSVTTFKITEIKSFNYDIAASAEQQTITFTVKSRDIVWSLLQIQFILHARDDLFSQLNQLNIQKANQTTEVSFSFSQAEPSVKYGAVHYILGISASATPEFNYYIQPASILTDKIYLRGKATIPASLKIQTIYFNTLINTFNYDFNTFTLNYANGQQFKTLWTEFAPVVYSLIGINKLTFKGTSLDLQVSFDLSTDLISISSSPSLLTFELTYLAIGQPPSKVCQPCDNYISIIGCLDKCPNNSYPESFNSGGKTCRKCSVSLGQTLNNDQTCNCPNSQVYHKGNCYQISTLPKTCKTNELLINGQCLSKGIYSSLMCSQPHTKPNSALTQCICQQGYQKIGQNCIEKCPSNSYRNEMGICICNPGFMMNHEQQCESICPLYSTYDRNSNACQCDNGYEMINAQCIPCSNGKVFDLNTRKCVATVTKIDANTNKAVTVNCQPNEIAINGVCQCDNQSIKQGQDCVKCPPTTFKQSELQCSQCPKYCQICSTAQTCTKCVQGFSVSNYICDQICGDGRKFILPCDDGNKINGDGCSSTCQIQTDFYCIGGSSTTADKCYGISDKQKSFMFRPTSYSPVFTSPGIVTDFVIYPPVKRNRGQLYQMFNIEFSNPKIKPFQILLSQSQEDLSSYRCFFDYHSSLPLSPFVVTFTITSPQGSSLLRIPYDPLNTSIKSAMHFMDQVQDVLT